MRYTSTHLDLDTVREALEHGARSAAIEFPYLANLCEAALVSLSSLSEELERLENAARVWRAWAETVERERDVAVRERDEAKEAHNCAASS